MFLRNMEYATGIVLLHQNLLLDCQWQQIQGTVVTDLKVYDNKLILHLIDHAT